MSEDDILLVERRGAVVVLTMNRPEKMNALSIALRARLAGEIDFLAGDDTVHAIVLTGEGPRAFSAGLDLKELGAERDALETDKAATDPVRAIGQCAKPVIAAVNGAAVTGGFELALACDIILAADNARFADTHVRVGVMPGWGLSQRLPRIVGPGRAKLMSLSGRFISAATAAEWGIAAMVVPADQLMASAIALAEEIADADADVVRELKRTIDDGLAGTLADGLAMEKQRATAWNSGQNPGKLEARRASVMKRGRSQG